MSKLLSLRKIWGEMDIRTAIGFKEWQVVCDALASGRQTILLRKGGIHEGRVGFSFAHESFFLFPTRFHALPVQVREGKAAVLPQWQVGDKVQITHHVEITRAITLMKWEEVAALEPLHIYSEQTVRDRFEWQGTAIAAGSIHLAYVRVSKLQQPWEFPYEPKYGGCRSWVTLPEPPWNWNKSTALVAKDEISSPALAGPLEPAG